MPNTITIESVVVTTKEVDVPGLLLHTRSLATACVLDDKTLEGDCGTIECTRCVFSRDNFQAFMKGQNK